MDVIKVFNMSQRLCSVRRYSQLHLVKDESVMEHTGFVCFFGFLLSEYLIRTYTNKNDLVLDFTKTGLGEEFIFNNPNVTASCGCGVSMTFNPV